MPSTATPQVAATQIANNVPVADLSIIGLFMHADFVVKFVMLLLLLASVACWAIIYDKWKKLKTVRSKADKFEEVFWSGEMLEHLHDRMRDKADHPMAEMFVAAMSEWKGQNIKRIAGNQSLKYGLKERIHKALHLARNRAIDKLEEHLSFLATVGATAPFVGLFGTVWGIMNSFQSIAASKNTTLAVVAPGIAEALFATAVGLFAAIPAVIFYNKLSSDVNRFVNRLDDFAEEFQAILSRELDEKETAIAA